jgi:ribosomal protein S16
MLVLRLQRIGKKHEPHYRLVVSEKREKLGAPPAEDLGSYNPKTKTSTINKDRVSYWLKQGAQASATVHNLLIKEGVVSAPKVQFRFPVKPKEAVEVAAAPAGEAKPETEAAAPAEEAPKSE